MSGICDTCMSAAKFNYDKDRGGPCGFYKRNTNYNRLFSTPERAARTLVDNCEAHHFCEGCPADGKDHDCTYDALLEWLRGDA